MKTREERKIKNEKFIYFLFENEKEKIIRKIENFFSFTIQDNEH